MLQSGFSYIVAKEQAVCTRHLPTPKAVGCMLPDLMQGCWATT